MVVAGGDIFVQIGIVVIIAAVFGYFFRLIKQSQLLGYILVGILISPVTHLITETAVIESMSVIGIAFLLFIVGLEMDLKSLKTVLSVSTLGGLLQVITVFLIGYFTMLMFGFMNLEAAYVGLIIAFSSTMVVMKLLSDKRELGTLHGRIAIGILLMQDVIAIFALTMFTSVNGFNLILLGVSFLKFFGILIISYVSGKWIFPPIFRFAARNQEILLVSSVGVCFLFSLLFHYLGLSIAIGAFIAGVTLGNLRYNVEIIAKVTSLKDFFAMLFFVSLGMGVSLGAVKELWLVFIVLLFIVLLIKPFVIMFVCSLFKYTKKPSFLTANSLAQVGEFSLILAAQGIFLGHLTQELFSIIVLLTIVTIVLTSYYIEHSGWFYKLLSRPLKIFDFFTTEGLEYLPTKSKTRIILCGHNRVGYSILKKYQNKKNQVLVVDFNPEVIHQMVQKGYHCIYGDATDDEILSRMNLSSAKLIISTIPGLEENSHIIRKVREVNKRVKIIVTALDIDSALKLYQRGAQYVIMPHFLGGEHVSQLITDVQSKNKHLRDEKKRHIQELKERINVGHEHPGGKRSR